MWRGPHCGPSTVVGQSPPQLHFYPTLGLGPSSTGLVLREIWAPEDLSGHWEEDLGLAAPSQEHQASTYKRWELLLLFRTSTSWVV